MNDILRDALVGEVTVTLAGRVYPLAFPMQGVILYKRETARLDRERKLANGSKPLTREAKQDLRERRRSLIAEADALRPDATKEEKWDDGKFALFQELLAEAMTAKAALDEDAAAGDSLYDKSNWWKISPDGDPERLLLALWVGLHTFKGAPGTQAASTAVLTYVESFTRAQLGSLIDLRNGEELTEAIAKALRAHMIAPPEPDEEKEALPNVPPLEVVTLNGK